MKYSDKQRLDKIVTTTEKLLTYLSDAFKQSSSHIPWAKISGLQHRLVHDYDNMNWSLICTILFEVLPGFLQDTTALRDTLLPLD